MFGFFLPIYRCMLWVAENNTLWCGSRDRNIYLWTLKD